MMRSILLSLAVLAVVTPGSRELSAAPGDEQQIRAVLDQQAADWNRGDIRAYMKSYDPQTKFVSGGVIRGAGPVEERYLKKYASKEQMGFLTFSDIEVEMLGANHASVTGQYHLKRTKEGGGDVGGWYSLVFRKTAAGWKIILDHTS
jgi:ketosteroid isomerase-like protein